MYGIFSRKVSCGAFLFLMATALLFTTQTAFAKGKGGRHFTPEQKLEYLSVALDLTEAQEKVILPILQQEADEIFALRPKHGHGGRGAKMEARGEIEAIKAKYAALIEAELTGAQAGKFRKLEELRNRKMGKKGKMRGPDPERKLDYLSVVLDLSETQQKVILPILRQQADEISALRAKYGDRSREDRMKARTEIRDIHSKYSDLVAAELTAEQARKFRELDGIRFNKMRCLRGK